MKDTESAQVYHADVCSAISEKMGKWELKAMSKSDHGVGQLRCIWLRLNCLNPSPANVELVSEVMRLAKNLLHGKRTNGEPTYRRDV